MDALCPPRGLPDRKAQREIPEQPAAQVQKGKRAQKEPRVATQPLSCRLAELPFNVTPLPDEASGQGRLAHVMLVYSHSLYVAGVRLRFPEGAWGNGVRTP
ncbi:protein of unknown function [Georgfuchsia toluolica]|uniref:Uncharacterized protein n=1 Tax=Georgfuchsia toluolica TaxID=424218 RepID=A0A916J602_9PROT|nr:protein of unknown function [Georgfuchsia toluolica]